MTSYDRYTEWKSWEPDNFGCCPIESALYFQSEMEIAGFSKFCGMRVLEIGYGNGQYATWVMSEGARWTGTEGISELVKVARARQWDAHAADVDLTQLAGDHVFDLAVAFDVFEHLGPQTMADLLAMLRKVLVPGGRVLGRVPSGDSPFSRAIQHGDLTHRQVLGSSAIRQLAEANGFKVIQIREPAFPVRGLGLSSAIRRLMVKSVRALVYPLIRQVFMGGGQQVLSPNIVFVLESPA